MHHLASDVANAVDYALETSLILLVWQSWRTERITKWTGVLALLAVWLVLCIDLAWAVVALGLCSKFGYSTSLAAGWYGVYLFLLN